MPIKAEANNLVEKQMFGQYTDPVPDYLDVHG
jgi:hypothetical protein